MSIGTKLIFLLTITVGAAMFGASFLSLKQREASLEITLREELRAHTVTLRIALEENYYKRQIVESRQLIDRLRENSRVYAVLLFDENSQLITLSQPQTDEIFRTPPELGTVLQTGETVEFTREIEGEKYFSVIMPLRLADNKRGALELVKPFALIKNDVTEVRANWLATTLFLLALIFLVVIVVLRRSLTNPFQNLLVGAQNLGRGNLDYRVEVPKTKDELAFLAQEFNRMADNLEAQRRIAEKEAENRLALERELRHTERLASVGRLAAGIAHELGTPLNVIDARAEQLLEKPETTHEKREKNLNIIRTQTEKISCIIRQLLTLARPYNFRLVPLDLNEIVSSTIEQIAANAKREKVEIEFTEVNNINVLADRDYLQQVILNILMNGIQAMSLGGNLKIILGKETKNGEDFVFVKFSDNGTGINAESLEKIFDPFFTTKDIGKGTGLGLAVSHRIIEEHGGFIKAENNLDSGATFTIYLPEKQ